MRSQEVGLASIGLGSNKRLTQYGATSIEYALVASLISIAIIGGLRAVSSSNNNIWVFWTSAIASALN